MPATGVELATAYVAVTLSMRGVEKSIAEGLSPAEPVVEKTGKNWGASLGAGLKTGAKAAGTAVAAVLGTALVKGFGRLSAIEEARASLSGLGNDAGKVDAIMQNALAAVKGTAFGMDEAAQTAAGAVAAGIQPGKDLEGVLRLVGDAATIGKTSMADMGGIFNKVATSGKVQGDVLAQLSDKGIPIVQLLAKELGVTAEETVKLASDGKINFETFRAAMEAGMGGAALKSGETTKGAFKNMMAAVSRLGAGLLKGVYPLFGKVFNGAGKMIDSLEAKLTPLATMISTKLADGISVFGAAWKRNDDTVTQSGFMGFIEKTANVFRFAFNEMRGGIIAFGAAWAANDGDITSSGFPGFMERLAFITRTAFNEMRGGIIAFGAAWAANDGDITSSGFPGFMERVAFISRQLWDSIKQVDFSSWTNFTASLDQSGGSAGNAMAGIGEAAKDMAPVFQQLIGVLPSVAGSLGTLLGGALTVVTGTLQFLADHMDIVIQVLPLVVAGFVAWKLASLAVASSQTKLQAAQLAMTPVLLVNNALRLIANALEFSNARASTRSAAATNISAAATTRASVATRLAAGAQRLLNLALNGNPIMKIVGLVALLVGALVWFFTSTETGQRIVQAVWSGIQSAISGLVSWFQDTALPVISGVVTKIGDFFGWLWTTAIKPAVDGISAGFGAVVEWFQGTAAPAISGAVSVIGDIFSWLYENIVKPVFGAIQIYVGIWVAIMKTAFDVVSFVITNVLAPVISWLWNSIIAPAFGAISTIVGGFYLFFRGIFQLVVAVFTQIIAPAFMEFWNGVIVPVFAGIWNVIQGWWTAVAGVFNAVVGFIQGTLAAVFAWFRDVIIQPVFNFIVGYINWWWTTVSGIFNAVVGFVQTVFSAVFTWLRDVIIIPVFNTIKNGISLWWDTVKLIFDTVVTFLKNTLGTAFTWLRDTIVTPVFNGIRDTIDGVWKNGIKPVFDTLSGAIEKDVPAAFEKGKEAIKNIWDKIQEIAKKPVRFVVNDVINGGLISSFNKIAGVLNIDTLPDVALPTGFRDGGYTGKLNKNAIAGVVHGDEHVIRAESRRSIEGAAPGLLERFNQMGARALDAIGYRSGGRVNPVKNMTLTQGYSAFHDGIDIGVGVGTPVFATGDGVVTHAGQGASAPGVSGGLEVHIKGDGIERWFAHLSQIGVKVGQQVSAGQQIALSGNTGISSGPHLHFGAYAGGWPNAMNPLSYLAGAAAPEGGDSGTGWLNPFGALTSLADGVTQKVKDAIPGGGFMVNAAAGIGKKLINDVVGWGKGKLGMGGVTGHPTLFDGGGWLENTGAPQLIDHQRRRPDAVLTNEQWALAERALFAEGKIENHFHELSNPRATAYQVARLQRGLPV